MSDLELSVTKSNDSIDVKSPDNWYSKSVSKDNWIPPILYSDSTYKSFPSQVKNALPIAELG